MVRLPHGGAVLSLSTNWNFLVIHGLQSELGQPLTKVYYSFAW